MLCLDSDCGGAHITHKTPILDRIWELYEPQRGGPVFGTDEKKRDESREVVKRRKGKMIIISHD